MATYGNGLTSVSFAPIAGDGGIGTAWTELGSTEQGSMNWEGSEGTKQEFFIEEQTDPVLVKTQSGSNTITWNCLDFSPVKMEEMFGGTVTGAGTSGDPFIYSAPVGGVSAIERSLKIVNGDGDEFLIVRASVYPTFSASFAKDQIAKVKLTATILTPTKAATASYSIKYAA
jgi:hypothetical protein